MSSSSSSDEEDTNSPNSLLDSEIARHSIRHVCIQQLHRATRKHTDALFTIRGKEFKRAIIVGNVCGRKEQAKQISYDIDDGTGRIQARFWQDPQRPEDPLGEETNELLYVRAIGELNEYRMPGASRPFKSFILLNIHYVEDSHEIDYHTLRAISDTLIACHGPPPPNPAGAEMQKPALPTAEQQEDAAVVELTSNLADTSLLKTPTNVKNARSIPPPMSPTPHSHSTHNRMDSLSSGDACAGTSRHLPSHQGDQPNDTSQSVQAIQSRDSLPSPRSNSSTGSWPRSNFTEDPYKDLDNLQRAVLLVISDHNGGKYPSIYPSLSLSYEGIHRDDIVRQVVRKRKEWSPDIVHRAVSELAEQSYIYPTVDDDHFGIV